MGKKTDCKKVEEQNQNLSQRSKSTSADEENVQVTSVEDDDVIETTYHPGDESYCQSELSSDEEQEHTSEICEDEGELETDCNDQPTYQKGTINRQKEVDRIDHEMATKIKELHGIMKMQKMSKSTRALEECLKDCENLGQGQDGKKSKNKGKSTTLDTDLTRPINRNSNAIKNTAVNSSFSEETIYRQAIPLKPFSSSSEEEVNTSDEFTENLNQLLITG